MSCSSADHPEPGAHLTVMETNTSTLSGLVKPVTDEIPVRSDDLRVETAAEYAGFAASDVRPGTDRPPGG